MAYVTALEGIKPVPEQFTVKWKVEPHFLDESASPGVKDATTETLATLR